VTLERAELEKLYLDLEKPLYNFALRWVWNPRLAEELVQEAFLRLWRYRDNVDMATVKGLLYKTLQNLALNERRKVAIRQVIPFLEFFVGEESEAVLEADAILKQDLQKMKTVLEGLPHELREILLMCEFSDMTYDEIGIALEIPAGTVASRKNRAMKMLKDEMNEDVIAVKEKAYGKLRIVQTD
jgi:RNA polymerase sigma-70 factor (ECF subfamily)